SAGYVEVRGVVPVWRDAKRSSGDHAGSNNAAGRCSSRCVRACATGITHRSAGCPPARLTVGLFHAAAPEMGLFIDLSALSVIQNLTIDLTTMTLRSCQVARNAVLATDSMCPRHSESSSDGTRCCFGLVAHSYRRAMSGSTRVARRAGR